MAIVYTPQERPALEMRGKLGRPCGIGLFWLGFSRIGEFSPFSGVYQKRKGTRGQIIVKMKHYRTANPQTTNQQNWRNIFASAVSAWHELSDSEKLIWRRKKHPAGMTGFNRFIRQYLMDSSA